MTTATALTPAYERAARDANTPNEAILATPFLVYGTLRENQGNDRIWKRHGGHSAGVARLTGYEMYSAPHGGFPYVVEGSSTIAVEVIHPATGDTSRLEMRHDLDRLEGFSHGSAHNFYTRVAVRYFDPAEQMLRWAWVYVNDLDTVQGCTPIPSGNWLEK